MTETTPRQAVEAVVRGRVQGVGFRYHVLRRATALELVGWVRNDPDGSVRCRAEGPAEALAELLADLRLGPAGARVEAVELTWLAPTDRSGRFTIVSGGHPGD